MLSAQLTDGNQEVLFATRLGMSLRIHESQVRAMGREARGVIGIRMKEQDQLVTMEVLQKTGAILTVTENGYGKKTLLEDYPLSKNRGNQGVRTIKTSERNGHVIGALEIGEDYQVLLVTQFGKVIRIKTDQIPVIGRITQGVRLFNLEEQEKVIDIARLLEESDEEEEKEPL
jgi:DNA gyrase subunit A